MKGPWLVCARHGAMCCLPVSNQYMPAAATAVRREKKVLEILCGHLAEKAHKVSSGRLGWKFRGGSDEFR